MTQSQSVLDGLVERLGKATGPDREIDCRLHWLASGETNWATALPITDGGSGRNWFIKARELGALPYTNSIDAAVAFMKRKLPEWWWLRDDGQSIRVVGPDNGDSYPSAIGRHHLVPIAMILATLSALKSLESL